MYSNLSPNDPLQGGWTVAGPGSPFSFFFTIDTPAFAFTSVGDFQFTELDVVVQYAGTGVNAVTVDLRADESGLPGAILETWTLNGLPNMLDCCAPQSLTYAAGTAAGPVLLRSSNQYWVSMSGGNGTFDIWMANNTGAAAFLVADLGSGFHATNDNWMAGAFAVQGTATPEPASWQLAGLALLTASFALRGRGKHANQ